MARYRLRFLLQELDLLPGITVVGRSLECNLTIEDPLVSRQHARITVDEDGARLEDLASRNGVRVNGAMIRAPAMLRDGDRIRIGTQDFVFCSVDPAKNKHARTTGVLRICANCRLPYPRELLACPSCEEMEQMDEETLSGIGADTRGAWSIQLLLEALERAITLGRFPDAERIVRRAIAQVEELLVSGGGVETPALAALARQAVAVTLGTNDPTWALWVFDIYRRTSRIPPLDLVQRLSEAAIKHASVVRGALGGLLEHLAIPARTASEEDLEAYNRLERLRRALEEAGYGSDVTGGVRRPS